MLKRRSLPTRLKILKAFRAYEARTHPHRYDLWRTLGMTTSLALLFLVPLSGLARIDLWGSRHYLLFEPAGVKPALAGVLVGICAMYVVTFLVNVIGGRMFCGWGCPVGQLSRFGEAVDTPRLGRSKRWLATSQGAAFGGALVLSVMAWWTDLAVLWRGSPAALATGWSVLLAGIGWSWIHGRWWQWEFCKGVCPIGLYYSFVAPSRRYGVHFRNRESTCIECDACDNVCPVDLHPRQLMDPIPVRSGIAIADAPGRNHCLECGDCVRACEWIIAVRGREPVPLKLGFFRGPQREDTDAPALRRSA